MGTSFEDNRAEPTGGGGAVVVAEVGLAVVVVVDELDLGRVSSGDARE